MKYQCHECDGFFDEPDIIKETHGFTDGSYEEVAMCPYCRGYFEPVYRCKICNELFTDDEINNGVCDGCLYEPAEDIGRMLTISEEFEPEKIGINRLVAWVFTEEQINTMLINKLKEISEFVRITAYEFIDDDKYAFADKLKELKNAEEF